MRPCAATGGWRCFVIRALHQCAMPHHLDHAQQAGSRRSVRSVRIVAEAGKGFGDKQQKQVIGGTLRPEVQLPSRLAPRRGHARCARRSPPAQRSRSPLGRVLVQPFIHLDGPSTAPPVWPFPHARSGPVRRRTLLCPRPAPPARASTWTPRWWVAARCMPRAPALAAADACGCRPSSY